MSDDLDVRQRLDEQQRYYGAVAAEYDLRSYGAAGAPLAAAPAVLDFLGLRGDVLELACGTGQWSRLLRPRVRSLTCVDSAGEMLACARRRTGRGVDFVQADIFEWSPARRYDGIFFGFWLTHVPTSRWPSFWSWLASTFRPGGVVGVIDETGEGVAEKERWTSTPDVVTRRVADGREFDIVKLSLDPPSVVTSLSRLGWQAQTLAFQPGFVALRATYSPESGR